MPLTTDVIAKAARCPLANVEQSWPLIVAALEEQGIRSDLVEVAVAATVAVETGSYLPIKERRASQERQPGLWGAQSRYWSSGYYGRGYIQLTWQKNYKDFGEALGLDLLLAPDLLLDPGPAARVIALYFKRQGVAAAANAKDWRKVRRLVNGGLTGWDAFYRVVCELNAGGCGE